MMFSRFLALSVVQQSVKGVLSLGSTLIIFLEAVFFLIVGALLGMFIFNRFMERLDCTSMAQKYPEVDLFSP